MEKINYKEKVVCILDNGSYVPVAIALSKQFGTTYYYSRWESAFPRLAPDMIGTGIDGVERISNIWDHIDEIDLFVICDIYFSDWTNHLRSMGKRVWGGGDAQSFETERWNFRKILQNANLLVAPAEKIKGIKNLREFIKTKNECWIKIEKYRGETETFHHSNEKITNNYLDDLAHHLGPMQNILEFICEDPIDSVAEVGYDGYCVNGQFPKTAIWGVEVKDAGYLGSFTKESLMPKPIQECNQKLSKAFKEYEYIGDYSNEIRYTKDKKGYLLDMTIRCPAPPTGVKLSIISNWADIMWNGAEGKMVDPIPLARYGCEIILKSDYCAHSWLPVYFPKEVEDNIFLKCSCKIDGQWYIVPTETLGYHMSEFGSLVVIGNSIEDILEEAKEKVKMIECTDFRCTPDSIDKAYEQIAELKKLGFSF